MNNVQSLSHTAWECKYHVVWIPKYRKKKLYGKLRAHLGALLKDLARQKESTVVEGHLMGDHVHMLLSIPPKYAVSQVIGFIKGKSAIHISENICRPAQEFHGSELLGTRLLCINSRYGRGSNPRIYPEAGKRRPAYRSTGYIRIVTTFRW